MPLPDTEVFNIQFVNFIETLPVLYDYNLKEYSNRNEQEKAWRLAASKFDATGQECKAKWKNIRGGLTRFLKVKNSTGSACKKPYYLWEVLQFILPYTKSRQQTGNIPKNIEEEETGPEPTQTIEEEEDTSRPTNCDISPETSTSFNRPSTSTSNVAPPPPSWGRKKEKRKDPLEAAITQYFTEKSKAHPASSTNSDLDFLKSLLPDIATLPPPVKRKLKKQVIQMIDDLIEEYNVEQVVEGNNVVQASNTITGDDDGQVLIYFAEE